MIERQEPHSKPEVNPIAPGRLAVHFPHVAPDIIESIQMYDLIENIIHLHHLYCYSRHLLLHVARILLSCRKITLIDRLLHFEFNNSFLKKQTFYNQVIFHARMKYSNDIIYIYCLEIFTRLFILSVTFLYRLRIVCVFFNLKMNTK